MNLCTQVAASMKASKNGTMGDAVQSPTRGPRRSHLDWLESEAIFILREVAGECANPALLFSGGKDSLVLLRLAERAFRPARFPFPLLHIDTGHNFPEVLEFRDARVAELGERLLVRSGRGLDRARHCAVATSRPTAATPRSR